MNNLKKMREAADNPPTRPAGKQSAPNAGYVSDAVEGDYFVCDWCGNVVFKQEPYQAHDHGFCNKKCADDYEYSF